MQLLGGMSGGGSGLLDAAGAEGASSQAGLLGDEQGSGLLSKLSKMGVSDQATQPAQPSLLGSLTAPNSSAKGGAFMVPELLKALSKMKGEY